MASNLDLIMGTARTERWLDRFEKLPRNWSMAVINIGGNREDVRWWSLDYWRDRKRRQRDFERYRNARLATMAAIATNNELARKQPRLGSPEWYERQRETADLMWMKGNLIQEEPLLGPANQDRVSAYAKYEKSWKKRAFTWLKTDPWYRSFWSATAGRRDLYFWAYRKLHRFLRPPVSFFSLGPTEKIRVAVDRGQRAGGYGVVQKTREDEFRRKYDLRSP